MRTGARVAPNPAHSLSEQRFIAIGRCPAGRPVFIAFVCLRASARSAPATCTQGRSPDMKPRSVPKMTTDEEAEAFLDKLLRPRLHCLPAADLGSGAQDGACEHAPAESLVRAVKAHAAERGNRLHQSPNPRSDRARGAAVSAPAGSDHRLLRPHRRTGLAKKWQATFQPLSSRSSSPGKRSLFRGLPRNRKLGDFRAISPRNRGPGSGMKAVGIRPRSPASARARSHGRPCPGRSRRAAGRPAAAE